MPYKRPVITYFMNWTTREDLVSFVDKIITVTYDDNITGMANTLEIITSGVNAFPRVEENTLIELRFRYANLTDEVSSGICRIDYVNRNYGPRQTLFSALQYNWVAIYNDNDAISYNNIQTGTIENIVASQFNFFNSKHNPAQYQLQRFVFSPFAVPQNNINAANNIRNTVRPATYNDAANRFIITARSRLDLLKDVADRFGYIFNFRTIVRNDQTIVSFLIFAHYQQEIENRIPIGTLSRENVLPGVEFRTEQKNNLSAAANLYYEQLGASATGGAEKPSNLRGWNVFDNNETSNRVYQLPNGLGEIYGNNLSASQRSIAILYKANLPKLFCTLECEGGSRLLASEVINLEGFDPVHNGRYVVHKARHSLSDRGWLSKLEMYKVGTVAIANDPKNPYS